MNKIEKDIQKSKYMIEEMERINKLSNHIFDDEIEKAHQLLNDEISKYNDKIEEDAKSLESLMSDIREENISMLDYFKKTRNDALIRQNFQEVNRLDNIIYQLEDVENFCHFKSRIEEKPSIVNLNDKFLNNFDKEIEKANRRLTNYKKYKYDNIETLKDNLDQLSLDSEKVNFFYKFIIKEINFLSLSKYGLFFSKLMFNVKLLVKQKEEKTNESIKFENNLISFMNFLYSFHKA